MTKEKSDYLSYLLRLWRESEEKTAWRASIESSRTGERKGFASLDDLFDFLRRQIGAASDAMETETRAERGDDDMVTK
jgi:hypothetical protein